MAVALQQHQEWSCPSPSNGRRKHLECACVCVCVRERERERERERRELTRAGGHRPWQLLILNELGDKTDRKSLKSQDSHYSLQHFSVALGQTMSHLRMPQPSPWLTLSCRCLACSSELMICELEVVALPKWLDCSVLLVLVLICVNIESVNFCEKVKILLQISPKI
jgi:hypothetical protein